MQNRTENLLLWFIQAMTLATNFLVLKINTGTFNAEDIGKIALFVTTLALISNFRLSGIDHELTREFIQKIFPLNVKSFLVAIIFSNVFACLAIYAFDYFFISIPVDIKLVYLYAVSFCFDRSTAIWLPFKRFVVHRLWFLWSALCVLAISISVYLYQLELRLYLTLFLLILIATNFTRALLTFRHILTFLDTKQNAKIKSNISKTLPIYTRIFIFSAIGLIQALNTSIERLIVGSYSLELVGEITVGMSLAIGVREVAKATILKNIFHDALSSDKTALAKGNQRFNAVFAWVLYFCLIFSAVSTTKFIFGETYNFGLNFALLASCLVVMQTILGRTLALSGLINSTINISILVISAFISYTVSLFILLQLIVADSAVIMISILMLSTCISLSIVVLIKFNIMKKNESDIF